MELKAVDSVECFAELRRGRYHFLSRSVAGQNVHLNRFREHPAIVRAKLKEGSDITIRAFFAMNRTRKPRAQNRQIDREVEYVDAVNRKWFAINLTELPATFPLARSTTIELDLDELLDMQT